MPVPYREWYLTAYWVVWYVVLWLPRFLYRDERLYEAWEIYEAHPQYARMLRLYPYVTTLFAAPLFAGLLYVVHMAPWNPHLLVHLAGLIYGGFLILDSSFVWQTGIRRLPSFGHRLFVIEEEPSWKTKLMMRIAFVYCAVALALLSATA